ncbi:hypothetical protein, partial [Zunongwangia sp.]|uniref:hypothetical protein n=1 Tax=Zunongwangia sp. TaxID=1965325 RepID=UPI003AA95990
MNEYCKVLLIFVLITFFYSRNSIYSQEKIDSIYQSYYKEVGLENTALFYGKEYLDKEATINDNNKFLKKSNDFSNGDIIYRNHLFKNILLKYNVVD